MFTTSKRKEKKKSIQSKRRTREISFLRSSQHSTGTSPEQPNPVSLLPAEEGLGTSRDAINSPPPHTNRFEKGLGKPRGSSPLPAWSCRSKPHTQDDLNPQRPRTTWAPLAFRGFLRASPSRAVWVDVHCLQPHAGAPSCSRVS